MRHQQLEAAQDRAPIGVIRAAKAEKGRIEGALQGVHEAIGAVE